MHIAVVGTGYVGLVTGVVLAELGNQVVCVDKDPKRLAMIEAGESPIHEPGLEEMMRKVLGKGLLKVSADVEGTAKTSEIIFIAVGTPTGQDGAPDLSAVRDVAAKIGKGISGYTVVVNKSTVPVGSGDVVSDIIRAQGVKDDMFDVVSNPEFLREGTAIQDTLHPDRVVIGAKSAHAAQKLVELYAPLNCPVQITDINSAELIKYASNCFLATKISFINAMSRICEASGGDVAEVAKGMGSDKRIGGQFLQAGLGWGGSCFPKDVQGLISTAEDLGYNFRLLRAVSEINQTQTTHFLKRLETRLGGLAGKKIGLLGLAFKPDTDDIRDAKSLALIEDLLGSGAAVSAYDPIATPKVRPLFTEVAYCESAYEVADKADAVLLVTEWNEFRGLDLSKLASRMRTKLLFDGRRFYSREAAEAAGLEYFTVGS